MGKKVHGMYSEYPGVGKIYDEDVYKLVKKHSRLIDRLSRSKMVEMTLLAQCILQKLYKNIDPDDMSWTFYGKKTLYNRDNW